MWTGHRTGWLRLQFAAGVLNVYGMVRDLDQGATLGAAISGFCVLVTASWKLPPIDEKDKR